MLQNVLENAISFSPAGTKIAVSLRVSADTVELTVDDEGPGIDAEKIDGIFQRYFSLRPEDGIGSDRAVEPVRIACADGASGPRRERCDQYATPGRCDWDCRAARCDID